MVVFEVQNLHTGEYVCFCADADRAECIARCLMRGTGELHVVQSAWVM